MFSSVNTCWTLVGAFLVYFMQAGFALCEAGFTRAKNTGNILMKNMMDFCIGTPCYWLIGFGLMFGGTGALIGGFDPFIQGDYSHLGLDIPLWVYIVFQTVFCATAATIVSGSMAERTNFKAYCVYSAAISLVVYPICGHWMWGGGWLQSMGFHDFAGSAAVHNVGGVIALLGAWMLGPRIGKYDKNGNPHAIPGHNLTAGALGVFILWFCWFGFNGGSSLSLSTDATMTLTGLVCVDVYVVVVMFIIFKIIDKTLGLRVPAEVEIDGLDIHEHGLASAYAGFAISDANSAAMTPNENTDLGEDDITKASAKQMDAAVPVVREPVIHDGVYDTGMHKVSIIAKLAKFDQLKTALNDLGVTGMTVTQVMGCGIQKGTPRILLCCPRSRWKSSSPASAWTLWWKPPRKRCTPAISAMARSLSTT